MAYCIKISRHHQRYARLNACRVLKKTNNDGFAVIRLSYRWYKWPAPPVESSIAHLTRNMLFVENIEKSLADLYQHGFARVDKSLPSVLQSCTEAKAGSSRVQWSFSIGNTVNSHEMTEISREFSPWKQLHQRPAYHVMHHAHYLPPWNVWKYINLKAWASVDEMRRRHGQRWGENVHDRHQWYKIWWEKSRHIAFSSMPSILFEAIISMHLILIFNIYVGWWYDDTNILSSGMLCFTLSNMISANTHADAICA